MTDDQKPQQEAADQDTHSVELDEEAMKLMQEWALDQGFALEWLHEETITLEGGASGNFRFERVPFELQEFGTVLIPDPRILEQGPLEVGIYVFEPQHDPMARGRPRSSDLYNEIKNAAALQTYYLHCALQLKQRLAVHKLGMSKKDAAEAYDFHKYIKDVKLDLPPSELIRIGSSLEKERDRSRTEAAQQKSLNNAVLAAQKELGDSSDSWAEASIARSTNVLTALGKAHYAVKTLESQRRAALAADRKTGSTTHAELQERLFGGIKHDRIRTEFVEKTMFSFFTGINASRVWVDTCLAEWQKFFELVVFTGQLYDGGRAILTKQIFDTYVGIDRALTVGTVGGQAEAAAYAVVVDQLHLLVDEEELRIVGGQISGEVEREILATYVGDEDE